ncbi:hypothetical protein L7F22_010747 [Adiantum nelumboides]|nr:hypothetical protein [Adiantum nelumboides]
MMPCVSHSCPSHLEFLDKEAVQAFINLHNSLSKMTLLQDPSGATIRRSMLQNIQAARGNGANMRALYICPRISLVHSSTSLASTDTTSAALGGRERERERERERDRGTSRLPRALEDAAQKGEALSSSNQVLRKRDACSRRSPAALGKREARSPGTFLRLPQEYVPTKKTCLGTLPSANECRAQGEKNVDLWTEGCLYPKDPSLNVHPPFTNIPSLLQYVENGEQGLLG